MTATKFNLLGHRGLKAKILENSKEGFAYAKSLQSQGLAGIEFDIQLTADGELLVFHDNDLKRLCGKQGRIEQLPAHTCQQIFQQTTGHSLLILAEVTPYLQGFRHIELEVKTHQRMNNHALIERLQSVYFSTQLQNLPIVLTSFDTDILQRLQHDKKLSKVTRGLLVEDEFQLSKLINTALRLQCCQIGINYQLITQEVVQSCHRYGLKVTAWTVNDVKVAKALLSFGVDSVISDDWLGEDIL